MTFNMENRLRAIAIPGSVGILLRYVGLPEAARFLLSAVQSTSTEATKCSLASNQKCKIAKSAEYVHM